MSSTRGDSGDGTAFAVALVEFDHDEGGRIQSVYPPAVLNQEGATLERLPAYVLCDGIHQLSQDVVYFIINDLKAEPASSRLMQLVSGVAIFRQVHVHDLAANLTQPVPQVKRNKLQKALCILCRGLCPRLGYLHQVFSKAARSFFSLNDFANVSNLQDIFDDVSKVSISVSDSNSTTPFYTSASADLSVSLEWLMQKIGGASLLRLFKAMLVGSQILIYGLPLQELTGCVLLLASMVDQCLSSSDLICLPYYPLGEIDQLLDIYQRTCGQRATILLGTSNPLHVQHQMLRGTTMVLDLLEETVNAIDSSNIFKLTNADKHFAAKLSEGTSSLRPVDEWIREQLCIYVASLWHLCRTPDSEAETVIDSKVDDKDEAEEIDEDTADQARDGARFRRSSLLRDYNRNWVSSIASRPYFVDDAYGKTFSIVPVALRHPGRGGSTGLRSLIGSMPSVQSIRPILGSVQKGVRSIGDSARPHAIELGNKLEHVAARGLTFAKSAWSTFMKATSSSQVESED